MRNRAVLFSLCLGLTAIHPRPIVAQSPVRFSGAVGLALPIGDLGNAADPGINLALRGEGKLGAPNWSLRGDLSWDRFSGKRGIDAFSYLALAGNLVHRSGRDRLYEFGGVGIYGSKTSFGSGLSHDDTNLGLQGGIGLDLSTGPNSAFVEFGLTNVITSGSNSTWFPVRIGIRF